MRGEDRTSGALFSYLDVEARIGANPPLRAMRRLMNAALAELDARFSALYEGIGRPSIPPERLLRASLLQLLYSIRSERQLVERLEFDMLFRWFVGLSIDENMFDASTFSRNRDLQEPRPPAHPRDRARVSVLASRPAGGEGAFERRAFFGRWNDGESLGVDEELPSHGLIGRKSGERGATAKSTFARPSGRTRPTPRRRTRMRAFSAKAPDRRAVSPLLATS